VISLPSSTSIWIAAGITDMRRGFTGLSAAAQTVLEQNPYSGHVFVFRGKRGDLVKVLGGMVTDCVCSPSVWSVAFRLAAGGQRSGLAEPRTAVDAAGRHRLEKADPHGGAEHCGIERFFPKLFPYSHSVDMTA